MNNQEAFNNAYIGVLQQGRPAFQAGCMYRAPDGCKCGIGHSIPDALYHRSLEGTGIRGLLDRSGHVPATVRDELREFFRGCDPVFLRGLQIAHDDAAPAFGQGSVNPEWRDEFIRNMVALAQRWKLTVPDEF